MAVWQRILLQAARRIAADPRTHAKAAELFETKVKPRAEDAARRAKPKIEAAKAELRKIATEADPAKEPARFAGKVTRRLIDKARRRGKDK